MKKRANLRVLLPFKIFHITSDDHNLITGLHQHTSIEFACVLSGKGRIEGPDGAHNFEPGEVFVYAPGESHRVAKYTPDTDILCLDFEPYYIWHSASGFSDSKLLDSFLNRSSKYKNKLSSAHEQYVYNNVCTCEEELINMEEDYLSAIKAKIADTLLYILRNCGFAGRRKMSASRSYNLASLKKSMDYIDANLHEELDLDKLAVEANMSRSYFCTIFKRSNGIKPWDYITIKRIDKALNLIAISGEKKLNIAFDCGFNNAANFYRAFKNITGKTPGDYINNA